MEAHYGVLNGDVCGQEITPLQATVTFDPMTETWCTWCPDRKTEQVHGPQTPPFLNKIFFLFFFPP